MTDLLSFISSDYSCRFLRGAIHPVFSLKYNKAGGRTVDRKKLSCYSEKAFIFEAAMGFALSLANTQGDDSYHGENASEWWDCQTLG